MIRQIGKLLPRPFRPRAVGVACSLFVRALLNMVGLAMLVPILAAALDPELITGEGWIATLYTRSGCPSVAAFAAWAAAGTILLIAIKCLINFLLARIERRFIYDLYSDLSRRLFIGYHQRGLHYIKSHNSAHLARNVNVVSLAFTAGVLKPLAAILSEAMLLLLMFGALALYAPLAAGLTLLVFVPASWGYYRFVKGRINRYGELENRAQREKSRIVAECFRGYADIELSGAFPMMLKRFDRAMREVVTTRSREADMGQLPAIVTELGLAIGISLMALVSLGMGAEENRLLFGLFAVAALRLMPAIRGLMAAWTTLRYNRYTIEILQEADTESDPKPHEVTTQTPLSFEREIRLHGVGFTFPDSDKPLFEDLSLTIQKGEHIGFRGASGSGKTTLFNLLSGLYFPTQGEITIDGVPLNEQNRKSWQQRVGYVSQSLFLVDGTFAENVAPGIASEQIDRSRIEQALRDAQLGELIDTLPRGIDTPIGECGCRLSGGQRQRIGIARALYRQADLLLLDEATSALDSTTEQEINHTINALAEAHKGLTLLVIAHRETSLAACRRIITIGNDDNE